MLNLFIQSRSKIILITPETQLFIILNTKKSFTLASTQRTLRKAGSTAFSRFKLIKAYKAGLVFPLRSLRAGEKLYSLLFFDHV